MAKVKEGRAKLSTYVCVCFAWVKDYNSIRIIQWENAQPALVWCQHVSAEQLQWENRNRIADSASIKRHEQIKEVKGKMKMILNFAAQVQQGHQTTVLFMNKFKHIKTKKWPKHSHIFHACDKQKMDVSDHMTKHKTPGDVADPLVMAGHVWMAWTWLCLSGSFGIWSILHVANKFRLGSFCQGMFLWHLGWVYDFILVNLF